MDTGTNRHRELRARRIIERPRLCAALDQSSARVRVLVASAGFGKSTLATQWTSQPGRRATWYRARESAADVAVLCLGVASALADALPGCDLRVRERVPATASPSAEVEVLAEMLAEDIIGWPLDAWLVLDDYQCVAAAPEAERFLDVLIGASKLQVLVCGRCRPSWIAARDIFYGDVLELSQTALALTHDEARKVLAGWPDEQMAGLMALADGWPALIGFAGMAPTPEERRPEVPDALLEFFADEVLRTLDLGDRRDLERLALSPTIDSGIAQSLLGDRANHVIAQAMRTGILEDRGDAFELHPIARRTFERSSELLEPDRIATIDAIVSVLMSRRDWDSLFSLCAMGSGGIQIDSLLGYALPELLAAARLTTIEHWLALGGPHTGDRPVIALARGELSMRRGQHRAASVFAEQALRLTGESGELAYRALSLAGRAAHVACREAEALAFYQRAESATQDETLRREARWSQVMCASTLEVEEAHHLLEDLRRFVRPDDSAGLIRLADKQLSADLRFGKLAHLEEARQCAELLPELRDPVARCSFRSVLSYALALTCDYSEALREAEKLIEDAIEYRVDIAIPYGLTTKAVALAGMKEFDSAHVAIDNARVAARRINDLFGLQNAYAIEIRTLLQQRKVSEACAIQPPVGKALIKSVWAEARASRALALACIGRLDEATAMARQARSSSKAIEPTVLSAGVDAIVAAKMGAASVIDTAEEVLERAWLSQGLDLLVSCYRASPDLLDVMLRGRQTQQRIVYLLKRVDDFTLADEVGCGALGALDPVDTLSAREREIYEYLVQGLTNAEIGKRLFIAPSTVKIHVRHVYDKLGIRSRTALVLAARRNGS